MSIMGLAHNACLGVWQEMVNIVFGYPLFLIRRSTSLNRGSLLRCPVTFYVTDCHTKEH